jgi:hypothetical protein
MMPEDKIFDALCYVPTKEVILDLIMSLPPQMAPYLKNVFGPKVAPLLGMEAEELYTIKTTMTQGEMRKALAPRIGPLSDTVENFVQQLDDMGVEKAATLFTG